MKPQLLPNGKYKYVMGYTDLNGKYARVTATRNNKTRATQVEVKKHLENKIAEALNNSDLNRPLSYFIDKFLKYKSKTLPERSMHSIKMAMNVLNNDIIVKNITKQMIESTIYDLKKHYSNNSIKIIVVWVNNLFKYINDYHSKDFQIHITFKISKDEKALEKTKLKFIETNKLQETLQSIKEDTVRDFVTVQVLTGLRVGELLALTISDIDFKNNIISVTKTKLPTNELVPPKTLSSIRKVEFTEEVKKILLNRISNYKFIFKTSLSNVNYHLKKINLTTHAFRHTHVALLIEAGVPIKVISERLGHSDTNTTLNIYTHVTQNMKVDLKHKLNTIEKHCTFSTL